MISTTRRVFRDQVIERLRLHAWTFARDAIVVALAFAVADLLRFDGPVPDSYVLSFLGFLPVLLVVYLSCIYLFGIHRRIWQYAGLHDIRATIDAGLVAIVVVLIIDSLLPGQRPLPISVIPIGGMFSLGGLIAVRIWARLLKTGQHSEQSWQRMLIVGAGHGGQVVAADVLSNPQWQEHIVGFVDDDPRKQKMRIHGMRVLGTIDDLPKIVESEQVDIIAVAIPSATSVQLDRILALAQGTPARIQILPSRAEALQTGSSLRLRDVKLNDLLDRLSAAALDSDIVGEMIAGRVVVVTGAAGSIGSELCRQIVNLKPSRVLAIDNNESGLFYLERELENTPNGNFLRPVLADITDQHKLGRIFRNERPQVVFHAAAYKHVPILEAHPEEAVSVNVGGTLNLCRLSVEHGCERFVFISTDKAVHPANVLGFSKRIGELLVRAHSDSQTVFCSVRFGNVIGSRGSALPEFLRQIDAGGPVTVTHPDVERYFMTIPEAVSLVIQAGAFARGGELFMLDMGTPMKIVDLVKRIIRLRGLRVGADVEIVYTGLRPGEKLTEDLVFDAEETRPTENAAIYVVDDSHVPPLANLEQGIAVLDQLAVHGDAPKVRELLASVAACETIGVRRRADAAS